MPYKYIVDVDSKSFSGAPEAIHHARARLNWAGQHAVQDGSFTKFNELLTLGYFEKQKINVNISFQVFPRFLTVCSIMTTEKQVLDQLLRLFHSEPKRQCQFE
jgi:hypothetical protein